MVARLAGVCLLLLLGAGLTGAEDAATLLARSDAAYYLPAAQGVRDLAVEARPDPTVLRPEYAGLTLLLYYAGEGRQRVAVRGLPAEETTTRERLEAYGAAVLEYLLPHPAATQFANMRVTTQPRYTRLPGVTAETFYDVIGRSEDAQCPLREYRVLLDDGGLAHQVESVLADGTRRQARVINTRIGDCWHITEVTQHAEHQAFWQVDRIAYAEQMGFVLPVRVTFTYRDFANRLLMNTALPNVLREGETTLSFTLVRYHINQGMGSKEIPPAPTVE